MKMDRQYLRKADLVEALGLARSTISDWLDEFAIYIPIIRKGNVKYYQQSTIDVLQAIRELREEGFSKIEIMDRLQERGFAMTVTEEEASTALNDTRGGHRDNMMSMMKELVTRQMEQLQNHEQRIDANDGRVTNVERELYEVKEQLATSMEMNVAMMETMSAPWWQRKRKLQELTTKLNSHHLPAKRE